MVYIKYSLVNTFTNGPKKNLAVLAGVTVLTRGFFYKKMYGRFAGRPKKKWP